MDRNNIWILGATGFIGRALTQQLAQNKANRVVLFGHKTLPGAAFEPHIYLQGGFSNITKETYQRYPPAHIFHLARFAAPLPFLRFISSKFGKKSNLQLIDFLRNENSTTRLHYVSGSLMYGATTSGSHNETAALNPVGFAKAYVAAELPFMQARKQDLSVSFYRPGWILGPDSWFKTFFWRPFCKTGKVPYYGDGSQLMSLVSLHDCAAIIARGAEHLPLNEDLNVFAKPPITQKEFSEKVAQSLGCESYSVDLEQMKKLGIDRHAIEALTTSIPLSSKHGDFYNSFRPEYKSVEELIGNVCVQLQKQNEVFLSGA
ncbi:NAD-dependent epimerase/dehydratase family protein [bacterium]|nr:NAD-dependent epimerase/dehydratase family protein [bacterium]